MRPWIVLVLPLVVALLLLGRSPLASSDDDKSPPNKPGDSPKKSPEVLYAVRFSAGSAAKPDVPLHEDARIKGHAENMAAWKEKGVLAFGGPFLDGTGGMAVLRVATAEDADKLASSDPAVVAGLLKFQVSPWLLAYPPKPAEPPTPSKREPEESVPRRALPMSGNQGLVSYRIERRFAVPPERLFHAFTDSDELARWVYGADAKGLSAEVDPRSGGALRLSRNGSSLMRGVFVEVRSPSRIVYTVHWDADVGYNGPGKNPVDELIVVEIAPDPAGCRLTYLHAGIPADSGALPEHERSVRATLDDLERLLAAPARSPR